MSQRIFCAGPIYKAVGEDKRKEGDVIEEASGFAPSHLKALINRRVLVEMPRGEWAYRAVRNYKDADGTKPGEVIQNLPDKRAIDRLLRLERIERVDSADLEAPKKRGRPKGSKNRMAM